MPIYAIGDVQGCFAPLQTLLEKIEFDADKDTLWFAGDLINRGPQSLEVLRFVKSLGDRHQTVLGNHDLSLLAVAYGTRTLQSGDTLSAILAANDRDDLLTWLRHRPLLVHDENTDFVMTHAGLAPNWDLSTAKRLANEVEHALQGDDFQTFLTHMYGNQPDRWDEALTGMDRLRCITNHFTRMRFCHQDGRLDLSYKGEINNKPADLTPWFDVESRINRDLLILFGHWAALNGKTDAPNVFALDTGCIWGNCLTAMRLSDRKRFTVDCRDESRSS